jgi:hypothetical protein
MRVEPAEKTSDPGSLTTGGRGIRGVSEESLSDIAVAEAGDDMFAGKDGGEELGIGRIGWVEGAVTTGRFADGLAHGVQSAAGSADIFHAGESVKIAAVRGLADPLDAIEEGDSFRHGGPAADAPPAADGDAADFEIPGLIEDGFDAQDSAVLVVHLDGVSLGPMLDAGSLDAVSHVADDLALEGSMELAPKKAHDILRLEGQSGVAEQVRINGLQVGLTPEHDIRGELGLICDPVIVEGPEHISHEGVAASREAVEDFRPRKTSELSS